MGNDTLLLQYNAEANKTLEKNVEEKNLEKPTNEFIKQNEMEIYGKFEIKESGDKLQKQKQIHETEASNSDTDTSILDLNDDCLMSIFHYLTRHKQLHLAMVCQRFYNIFLTCTHIEYKNINLELFKKMSTCELKDFFEVFKPYMKTLCGRVDLEHIDTLVQMEKLDLNIDHIDVFCYWGATKFLIDILRNNNIRNVLTSFKINSRTLDDDDMLVISKLPNLTLLNIGMNASITGEHLQNLTQLKTLCLFNCTEIDDFRWIKACEAFYDLRALDLRGCTSITKHGLGRMLEICVHLEELRIDCHEPYDVQHYDYIAGFMCLKKLELVNVTNKEKQLITQLAERSNLPLKVLIINNRDRYSDHVNLKFLNIITSISSLKEIVLINCSEITDECVLKLGSVQFLDDLGLFKCRLIKERNLHILMRKLTHEF